MLRRHFRSGDCVVYTKSKCSNHPGPRARKVQPAAHGDDYLYLVDKFWSVVEAEPDRLVLMTRRGKVHRVSPMDPNLRLAHWWERWWYRDRFPKVSAQTAADTE